MMPADSHRNEPSPLAPVVAPAGDLTLSCLIHDLNNVFQTLFEAADLLSTDPHWSGLSAAIVRSIERGKGIAGSLQATENSGGAAFETILNNAIAFVEDSLIGGRGPKILFDCDIEPGLELRRKSAWERVLFNLFSNAVRAMPEGGVIHVQARRRMQQIEILVRDDGSGIPLEILDRVFEPSVSTKSSGGLGLHIVETIVKQADGEVRVANHPAGGAEFTITVPVQFHPHVPMPQGGEAAAPNVEREPDLQHEWRGDA
jgi:signal transduction histidine kinase